MLVIGNGCLVTKDPGQSFFENGAVAMGGTVAKKVGILEEIEKEFPDAEYVDAKRDVIVPALINTYEYTHSAMARGLSIKGHGPKGFLDVLDNVWWTIDRHLTNERTRQSARATYLDSIEDGITTVFDHHTSFGEIRDSLFAIEDAAKEVGIRIYLCYEVSDRDGMDKARTTTMESVSWIKHVLTDNTDMIASMMGMHAQFAISGETMELAAANKPAEVGYHIHVVKDIKNLHSCLKKYGKRIVDRLVDRNILGEKTLLAHCTYVNPHEMQLIKDTGTMMVHNPESSMGNACGCPSTMEIVHKGILTGLRTDSYTHDMIESFKIVNVLHKHHLYDASTVWDEVPQMLFKGSAKIVNHYFKKQLGVLKEGTAANVIVTDYIPLTPMNASSVNGHILFGMTRRSMMTTVCNGKVLMRNRELMGLDKEKILYEVRGEAKKLTRSING